MQADYSLNAVPTDGRDPCARARALKANSGTLVAGDTPERNADNAVQRYGIDF